MKMEERKKLDMAKLSRSYRSIVNILENSDIDKEKIEEFCLYVEALRYDRDTLLNRKWILEKKIEEMEQTIEKIKSDSESTSVLKYPVTQSIVENNYIELKKEVIKLKSQNNDLTEELGKAKGKIEKWKAMFTSVSIANANLINKGYSEIEEE